MWKDERYRRPNLGLISTTTNKGVELCEKVGFSNYNYFYTVFKKMTGMRPMDVRKKL